MIFRHIGYAVLGSLSVINMVADAAGWRGIKGLATATAAAPAPKVFTSARGLETFSSSFHLRWLDSGGEPQSLEFTPEAYARLRGPYNRRNVLGAAMAYGPVLEADERTRPMLRGILRVALRGDAPLLRELGIDPAAVHAVEVEIIPNAGHPDPDLPLVLRP